MSYGSNQEPSSIGFDRPEWYSQDFVIIKTSPKGVFGSSNLGGVTIFGGVHSLGGGVYKSLHHELHYAIYGDSQASGLSFFIMAAVPSHRTQFVELAVTVAGLIL